ncbi:MAG: phosphatidate cytidylyltransferase [Bacteroidales bacterium]
MNLLQRAITGALFGALVFGTIFAGSIAFLIFYLVLLILTLLEFYKLAETKGVHVQKFTGLLASVVFFLFMFGYSSGYSELRFLSVLFVFPPVAMIAELYRKKDNPFNNLVWTFFGIIYIAVPFSLLNMIIFSGGESGDQYNPNILAGIFILIMVNDTAAYLVGVPFGRHRLFESVSPKKTWEGTIGGGLTVLAASFLIKSIFPLPGHSSWMVIAAIIAVFGIYGDLLESLYKRGLGVKDSGKLLPGHGGVLDRVDAWLFVIPIVWVYLCMIV